jgi:hypothetical protein
MEQRVEVDETATSNTTSPANKSDLRNGEALAALATKLTVT